MENNKTEFNRLKEKLLNERKNGSVKLDENTIKETDVFCEGYKEFLNKAKTERESVRFAIELAKSRGFEEFDRNKQYKAYDKVYYNNRDKAIILAVMGKNGVKNGALIVASHIDSPRIDLKPNPLYESNDLAFFKTHYYGGIKKYQWTAIPLALHGVVIRKDLSSVEVVIGENEDDTQFCITDLLPHLGKEQMEKPVNKAFLGEDLNIIVGSRAFRCDEKSDRVKLNIMKILNEKYNITEEDFLSAELSLVPAFKARDIGFDRSMVGSYGHDDRVCAYTSMMATLDCKKPESTIVCVLSDKEETGSDGNTGLMSAYMKYFIGDLAALDNMKTRHVLSKSKCLSADVNAAYDPNFPSVYELNNSSYINEGAVLTKYTGSGGKCGTSDASAEFMGKIRNLFDRENILYQSGELGKVDAGGGGTVAQFIANLDVDVVDIGVPVLSMHSPFELVSKIDVFMLHKAVYAFFKNL